MNKKAFIGIFAVWAIIISAFVAIQEYTLITGKEVLLRTVPVDPRDLLRGDYVILNYEIAQLEGFFDYRPNETVYISLTTDDKNVAYASGYSTEKPTKGLFLKGKVGGCNTVIPFFRSGRCVNFGIESYFVKEGTGRELENSLRNGALVRVSVDKNGVGKVKGFKESK